VTALSPQAIDKLPLWVADHVATAAATALLSELETWPKPGLVSHVDSGSHTDMDVRTLRASAAAITPFFGQLTIAGASGSGMDGLRKIGVAAECAMLAATAGVNTHRGAIFGLGLICAAAGAAWSNIIRAERFWRASELSAIVRHRWGQAILRGPIPLRSHGTDAMRQFGAGGARAQAAAGFPHALDIGLPALRLGRKLAPCDPEAARIQVFFALLASMEDTNLLHRGGATGLRFAQDAATGFIAEGGAGQVEWRQRAAAIHHAFVARRLSPGGSADLLAITLFLDALETFS
jgi:triphosphoribosyl-dephospho-CoA synthase